MQSFLNPDDMEKMRAGLESVLAAGKDLHDCAMLVGYNVCAGIGGEIADLRVTSKPIGETPQSTFHVWRVDQPSDTAEIFSTVAEVDES